MAAVSKGTFDPRLRLGDSYQLNSIFRRLADGSDIHSKNESKVMSNFTPRIRGIGCPSGGTQPPERPCALCCVPRFIQWQVRRGGAWRFERIWHQMHVQCVCVCIFRMRMRLLPFPPR